MRISDGKALELAPPLPFSSHTLYTSKYDVRYRVHPALLWAVMLKDEYNTGL